MADEVEQFPREMQHYILYWSYITLSIGMAVFVLFFNQYNISHTRIKRVIYAFILIQVIPLFSNMSEVVSSGNSYTDREHAYYRFFYAYLFGYIHMFLAMNVLVLRAQLWHYKMLMINSIVAMGVFLGMRGCIFLVQLILNPNYENNFIVSTVTLFNSFVVLCFAVGFLVSRRTVRKP